MTSDYLATSQRTHLCGALRRTEVGQRVCLGGWVHRNRDLGGLTFLDLRDRAGIVQVSFGDSTPAEVRSVAASLGLETVVLIEGKVVARPEAMRNSELATGDVEVQATSVRVVGPATPPAIPVARARNENLAAEELRLRYRFLDLRRPELQSNILMRHRLMQVTRRFLSERGFFEIETPILTKPTPEGARDYLVPSRVHAGEFYALPQSPQLYKQLLMVSGFDRYFQIARCFRDEDLRADRQPEFTQIDIEASFVVSDDIFAVTEGMLAAIFKAARNVDIKTPFARLTYREALDRYGSDKPDRRFGMELVDLGETFRESSFKVFRGALDAGGVVKAINAKGFAGITIGQADELTEIAKLHGAKGLAFIKIENGEWKSPIVKFFSDAEKTALQSKLNIEEGDCVFFAADKWRVACEVLGRLRLRIAEMQKLTPAGEVWDFLWVTDFPLFEWSPDENKWNAMHHPFTRPKAEDMSLFEAKKFPEVRAEAYDVVLNGVEIGGGSMRIYEPQLQEKMFAALGISPEARESQFGHLLRAFRLGAPPHGVSRSASIVW